ncbi:MAG: hypothetical protein HQK89_07680 [Nitrospirae bacterium]|nr:hypothetical protein [Nitrospirota bacterium]
MIESKETEIIVKDNTDDDTYWIEKAIEAEKSGYAGYEESIEFLLERLV